MICLNEQGFSVNSISSDPAFSLASCFKLTCFKQPSLDNKFNLLICASATEIRGGGINLEMKSEYFAFLYNQRLTGVGVNLDNSAASRGCYSDYDEGGHGGCHTPHLLAKR